MVGELSARVGQEQEGVYRNLSAAEAAKLAKQIDAHFVVPCGYDLFYCNTAPPQMLQSLAR